MSQVLSFKEWYLAEQAIAQPAKIVFSFTFPEGKWKLAEIPAETLVSFKSQLAPIVNQLRTPTMANLKTTIALESATSPTNPTPQLNAELKAAGFSEGNIGLANARLKTIEDIVVGHMAKAFGTTAQKLLSQVSFTKATKPGTGTYIAASVSQTGDPFPAGNKLECGIDKTFSGVQGTKANRYIGYSDDLWLAFPAGQEITLEFDPQVVPDCIYVKYGNYEYLSGFIGKSKESGLLGDNFKDQLNDKSTAGRALVDSIKTVLSELGSRMPPEQIEPRITKKESAGLLTPMEINVIQVSGKSPANSKFVFKKQFGDDKLIIRVFAPLDRTQFKIKTACGTSPLASTEASGSTDIA